MINTTFRLFYLKLKAEACCLSWWDMLPSSFAYAVVICKIRERPKYTRDSKDTRLCYSSALPSRVPRVSRLGEYFIHSFVSPKVEATNSQGW